ncbi:hypothetical protein, partial [Escherichia coli]|uniref:hypothetical protein n=1 Tax=Escherichia coli TaxID=562 RepID=UPI0019623AC5
SATLKETAKLFVVRSSKMPSLICPSDSVQAKKSGQDVCLSDRARAIKQTPSGQGCAPTPRQRLTQPD